MIPISGFGQRAPSRRSSTRICLRLPMRSSTLDRASSPTKRCSMGCGRFSRSMDFCQVWSSTRPMPCPRAAPIDPDSAAFFAPIGLSASSRIAIIATSRSIASFANFIPISSHEPLPASKPLVAMCEHDPETDLLTINGEFRASIVIVRCQETGAGSLRWNIRFDMGLQPDITVAVRMDRPNREPLDYYLLPQPGHDPAPYSLGRHNGLSLDAYRFDTLDPLFDMATHVPLSEAA